MLHQADLATKPPSVEYGLSNAMLKAWWSQQNIFITNTFSLRPGDNNKIENLCVKKAEAVEELQDLYGVTQYPFMPLSGKYILPRYFVELYRLRKELLEVKPNLVLTCGATAMWALSGASTISKLRGAVATSDFIPGQKFLPMFHPAFVMRNWSARPICVADLLKAKREQEFSELRRPNRYVHVDPTIEEVEAYCDNIITNPPKILGCDIETVRDQLEMISFATSTTMSMSIPLIDKSKPNWNYWESIEDEVRAWKAITDVLHSEVGKCWQNGAAFDLVRLNALGIKVNANRDDTMLLSHSLYPEMQKGLAFLGSIHTNEVAWKLMRRKRQDVEKRDE